MVPMEPSLPIYAQVARTLQAQIEDGTYRPGTVLPSESQLMDQFGASRATVVRGLNMLKHDGWIESQQGRGYFVRGRPSAVRSGTPGYLDELLDVDESVSTRVVSVEPVLSAPRIASALDLKPKTPVYLRRRLVEADSGPVALSDVYVPVNIAVGTAIDQAEPLTGTLRRHIEAAGRARFDYLTQVIATRLATGEEAELLQLDPAKVPVLELLVTAHAADGTPLMAMELILPGDRHELEDSFSVSTD
jgi:GntR family transcriptional regulator